MGGLFGGGGGTITNETQMIKGLRIQSSTFGAPQSLVFGTTRVSGNLIDYMDFTAIAHTTTQTSGGKGGGGVTSSNTSYTYTVAAAIGLCAGPVSGIGRVFSDKDVKSLGELNLSQFTGSLAQAPWSYMLSTHPERALNYPYLCYVAGVIDLGENGSIPNWSFEVYGMNIFPGRLDANCYDVITTLLTDATIGANFPSAYIGDNSLYNAYCIANGLFISPAYSDLRQADDIINEVMKCSNSQPVVSQGKLYFKPYGTQAITGNGATYTPSLRPIYIIGDDDYIYKEGEDPVKQLRDDTVDRYNYQKVEFLNRDDNYSPDIAHAPDQASIDRFGLRPASPVTLHCIADANVAQVVAQTILQRGLYYPNQYEFVLPYYPFFLLDPMDLIAINDSGLGLVNTLVRVVSCDPDSNKEITFVVEEVGLTASSGAIYPRQNAERTNVNYNVSPGNVNPPVIFEPSDLLSQNGLEVWIGASGGKLWGGCSVWVSEDGNSYKRVGRITNPARQGLLATTSMNGTDPDTVHSLAVNMALSRGELLSGTKQDADNFNTLCYVDGELISYQTATLTGTNLYTLSNLRRGVYGTTIADHNPGTQFLRIDDAVFKYQFAQEKIGLPIYIKLTSFNIYGAGEQGLEDVLPYTYKITGWALNSPLPNVQGLSSYYENNNVVFTWQPVSDFRSPIEYEVRMGDLPTTAKILGRTMQPKFTAQGNGSYWIAAVYKNGNNLAYSDDWVEITITGARIVQNVLAQYDEKASGWAGNKENDAILYNDTIRLRNTGLFDPIADVDTVANLDTYGPVGPLGYYHIPEGHVVDIGETALCNVACSYSAMADSPTNYIDSKQDIDSIVSWDGSYSPYADIKIQINTAGNDGVWLGWQDFYPGQYYARKFDLRAELKSFDETVTAILTEFNFSVDVPDKSESANITVPTGGISVLYQKLYHAIPEPQITIYNAQPGDNIKLTAQTTGGFTIQIVNGAGNPVSRAINYFVQKY